MKQKTGLYIHIPFCVKKCAYCDFLSFGGQEDSVVSSYIDALCSEIHNIKQDLQINDLTTIYIGGGTPSILSVRNFDRLMQSVFDCFQLVPGYEFTVEVNPGTLTEELAECYIENGVNRISMGLQSSDDLMLEELGRIHSYGQFLDTFHLLKSKGIDNISVDVMFGLSGQTLIKWNKTLDAVLALKPKHISAYSLIIEEGTLFETRYEDGELALPDEDTERAMFWLTHDRLEEAGYHHYEISNYGLPGFEAKHNSAYWELIPYIGVGLGASSYYNCARYKNISDLNKYINSSGDLSVIRKKEQDNPSDVDLEEAFFLGLRKLDGIDLERLAKEYGSEMIAVYYDVIDELIQDGMLETEGMFLLPVGKAMKPLAKVIRLSKMGVDLSNKVMARFIL